MWSEGSILIKGKVYRYSVKHYELSSDYGINRGRISKIFVTREDMVVLNYDRGWDTVAEDEGTELCLAVLMKKYN